MLSVPSAMVGAKRGNRVSEQTSTPKLTGQFSKALLYAELKHHNQVRKGGDIPYVGPDDIERCVADRLEGGWITHGRGDSVADA